MKKLLLLLIIPFLSFGQQTYIPDNCFERYLILFGYDSGEPDNYVTTANISNVTSLSLGNLNYCNPNSLGSMSVQVEDLTGLEDFTALNWLSCDGCELTEIDISNNTNLEYLNLSNAGTITCLDISNHPNLTYISIEYIDLELLNFANVNYPNLVISASSGNNYSCVQVDNLSYAESTWLGSFMPMNTTLSENCWGGDVDDFCNGTCDNEDACNYGENELCVMSEYLEDCDGNPISKCEQCTIDDGFYCGDDESNWTYFSFNGCVESSRINNGINDCVDGSDEDNLTYSCNPFVLNIGGCTNENATNFNSNATYDDGSCISNCEACVSSGGFYCGDDESNWTEYSPNGCVPADYFLDGMYADCVDGSDEETGATADCENNSSIIGVVNSKRLLITNIDFIGREANNNEGFQLHIYDDGLLSNN